jgi:hypothetical protein
LGFGGALSREPGEHELRTIVIGLDDVDQSAYADLNLYVPVLKGAENDARDMATLLGAQAWLRGPRATRKGVLEAIEDARCLEPGGMLVIFFSGHGGRIRDSVYPDGLDSTWCLYDGELLGRELGKEWTAFQSGTKIVVVSDSCHSGTVIRRADSGGRKEIPREVQDRVIELRGAYYETLQANLPTPAQNASNTHAAVLLLSACKDEETTRDGEPNGEFTAALKTSWNGGAFPGDYDALRGAIQRVLRGKDREQTPMLFSVGKGVDALRRLKPFTP